MTWGQPLGLDELMIINPGLPISESYFLGDGGTVYQLQEVDSEFSGIGELFLGDDGTLYQLQSYRLPHQKRRRRKKSTCRCRRKSY